MDYIGEFSRVERPIVFGKHNVPLQLAETILRQEQNIFAAFRTQSNPRFRIGKLQWTPMFCETLRLSGLMTLPLTFSESFIYSSNLDLQE
jgi:hypothetical protein